MEKEERLKKLGLHYDAEKFPKLLPTENVYADHIEFKDAEEQKYLKSGLADYTQDG